MIRRYKQSDIDQIVELELKTLGTTLGKEMLEENLQNSFAYSFVYEEKKEIKGYISLNFDGYQGEILNFCVDSSMQNKGIGTKLICYALDLLFIKGAESFILEVRQSNERAIHLYKKIGFQQISIRKSYYSNGEDALVLLKQMVLTKDIENAYIQKLADYEPRNGYIEVSCKEHPTKYFLNYYAVEHPTDALIVDLKKSKKDFVQIVCDEEYHGNVRFSERETIVNYHANIYNIHLLRQDSYKVEPLHGLNMDDFLDFLYKDGLPNGEIYARANSKFLVDAALKKKALRWYMVYSGDKIVGAVSAFYYQDAVKLEDFFVLDEYQHMGFGSSLLERFFKDAKELGIHDVFLVADQDDTPKEMYERMGFTSCGISYILREVFE